MKKFTKIFAATTALLFVGAAFIACSDDNFDEEKNKKVEITNIRAVDATLGMTYKVSAYSLAGSP